MRNSWTDERLDDLNHKVDVGFERLDRHFERLEDRFDVQQRLMLHAVIALTSAMVAGFGGLAALIVTNA